MSEQEKYNLLIEALKAKAAEILPKGSRVALYGSRARGDARIDSDWDLHILIPGDAKVPMDEVDRFSYPFEQVGWEFNEFVSTRLYSFAGWLKRSFLPFYKNVDKDKIVIFQN